MRGLLNLKSLREIRKYSAVNKINVENIAIGSNCFARRGFIKSRIKVQTIIAKTIPVYLAGNKIISPRLVLVFQN